MLNAIAVAGSPGKEQQAVNGMFISQNVEGSLLFALQLVMDIERFAYFGLVPA